MTEQRVQSQACLDYADSVCPAWAHSNGGKSRAHPNSGKRIAKGKGVRREAESEGSPRQKSGLTDRNLIRGHRSWASLPIKIKPHSCSERPW